MKLLRKVSYTIGLIILISLTFQCASSKYNFVTQSTKSFKVKTVTFQKWYGDYDQGTGLNIFVPIVDKADNITIDSVYFRKFKAQLVRNYSRYTAVIKNNFENNTTKISKKKAKDPFNLSDNECVIRYIENDQIKYLKVKGMSQKKDIYYEDGPPLAYQSRRKAMIISEESSIKRSIPTFQPSTTFKVKTIAFQEWYAGIKVGGTGMNVFVPVVNKKSNIKIDSVYFRNLKGKLTENYGRYTAVLKNKSPYYTFKKAEKDPDFPFNLDDNECAISFVENGEVKYVKVTNLSEKEGVYYEDGPPLIYDYKSSAIFASNDKAY